MGLPPFEILPGGSDHLVNPFPSCSKGAELFQRIEPFLATLNLIRQTPSKMGSVIKELHSFSLEELLGNSIAKVDMADAVKAGLFLAVDAWDEAHGIAQDLDTVEGSYWHGIVHRREPDAANSKYWFRRVGDHPVIQLLAGKESRPMLPATPAFDEITRSGSWDPFRFIDLCRDCERECLTHLRNELIALQAREMNLLIGYCVRMAIE